jgi:hypothetical protein
MSISIAVKELKEPEKLVREMTERVKDLTPEAKFLSDMLDEEEIEKVIEQHITEGR